MASAASTSPGGRRASSRVTLACVALRGVVGCTPFVDDPVTDAASATELLDVPVSRPCDPMTSFGPPIPVPGLTPGDGTSVSAVRLSRDSLTAYFQGDGRGDQTGYNDLYTASRTTLTLPFGNIGLLAGTGIDTTADEFDPTVSGNGLVLVFGRAQPGGDPVHLFRATRATPSIPFADVEPLADTNDPSTMDDTTPFLREDGAKLYFASTRVASDGIDLYEAPSTDAGFGAPTPIDEVNTTFSELAPVVTPDDQTLYFGSDRSDGNARGGYDIWVATRISASAGFSQPMNVTELNSDALELPTFVTADGCTLYFSSTRSGTLAAFVATKARPQQEP
jgi:hypothetical protein